MPWAELLFIVVDVSSPFWDKSGLTSSLGSPSHSSACSEEGTCWRPDDGLGQSWGRDEEKGRQFLATASWKPKDVTMLTGWSRVTRRQEKSAGGDLEQFGRVKRRRRVWLLEGRGRRIREKSWEGSGRIPSPNVRVTWSAAQPLHKTQKPDREEGAFPTAYTGQMICFGQADEQWRAGLQGVGIT